MKIGGVDPRTLPVEEVLVLPRGDQSVVFRASGMKEMDEFKKLCPEPEPPGKLTKDGWVPDEEDEGYKSVLAEYHKRRLAYIVVHSLVPSRSSGTPCNWTILPHGPIGTPTSRTAACPRWNATAFLTLVLEANCLDEGSCRRPARFFYKVRRRDQANVIWPDYRTGEYAIWKACASVGHPPARRQGELGRLWRPYAGPDPGVQSDVRARRG